MVWCYSLCLGCGMTLGSRLPDPERKRLSHRVGECESPPEKGRQESTPGHLPHKRDCCITRLCCRLKVLRRNEVLIHLKPTISTPREYNNVWREQTK